MLFTAGLKSHCQSNAYTIRKRVIDRDCSIMVCHYDCNIFPLWENAKEPDSMKNQSLKNYNLGTICCLDRNELHLYSYQQLGWFSLFYMRTLTFRFFDC